MNTEKKTGTVPLTTMTEFYEVTKVHIGELVEKGVVIRVAKNQYDFLRSTKNYIRHLKTRKVNQWDSGDGDSPDGYEGHRARLTKAKADMAEVQAGILKGTAHEADAIKSEWSDMIGAARTKLLAMPTKLAPKVHGEESLAAIRAEIETAVVEALNELSEYEPNLVTRRYVAGHQPDLDTTAEVDGEPMGGRDPET